MRGLVTIFGGSGFIGSNIVRVLAKQGYRVRVAVRQPGRGYRLRMLGDVGQIEIVQANIRSAESVARALEGAEAAINAVGVLRESGRQGFGSLHADGAGTIAREAAAQGVGRLVHLSALGADADSPAHYARSKAAGEAAVRAAFPGAIILRPSVVFGPEDKFLNKFAAMAAIGPLVPLPLIGGGLTRFQPIYVTDLAKAAVAALAPESAGLTYELGGPAVYSFRELMELVLRESERSRILLPVPWSVAGLLGVGGDVLGVVHGIVSLSLLEPPITSDQVRLLRADNVVSAGAPGLADLGVAATALEPLVSTWLYRFRKGGQYADLVERPA